MMIINDDLYPIFEAVRFLAGVCDGARTHDGQGFNAYDTGFGRDLAHRPWEHWTPKMKRAAWKMIKKYRGQLAAIGVDPREIPEPSLETVPTPLTEEEAEDGWIEVE